MILHRYYPGPGGCGPVPMISTGAPGSRVPPLSEGDYRIVRRGPNGDHTGLFWVDDLGA